VIDGAEHKWVVLRTQQHREALALHSIAGRGVETYFPVIKRGCSTEALFPSYLFARVALGSDDLLRIRSVPGVAYMLPRGAPAALLPDDLIQALRARPAGRPRPLAHGDRVTIRQGPFRWLDAVFDRHLNASGRVRVLLEFVDRLVSIDLQIEDLR
jgi:transcription antitermination factor NusG